MKAKILSTAIFGLVLSQPVYAKDINLGTLELLGDASAQLSTEKDTSSGSPITETTKTTDLHATGLYYIQNNFGIGLDFTYLISKYSRPGFDSTVKATLISPVVGFNLSLDPTSSILLEFGLLGAIQGVSTYDDSDGDTGEADISGTLIGALYKKFVNPNVSLNFGVALISVDAEYEFGGKDETDSTDFLAGISVYF